MVLPCARCSKLWVVAFAFLLAHTLWHVCHFAPESLVLHQTSALVCTESIDFDAEFGEEDVMFQSLRKCRSQNMSVSRKNNSLVRGVQIKHASPNIKPFRMQVYEKGDIVSWFIIQKGNWEPQETQEILKYLQKGSPVSQQEQASTLLDIGANIGWFTLMAAAAGYDVVAFEPFAKNFGLIRGSLCDPCNPVEMLQRVSAYNLGLDVVPKECEMWQKPSENYGDTVSLCGGGGGESGDGGQLGARRQRGWARHKRKLQEDHISKEELDKARARYQARGFVKLGNSKTGTLDGALEAGVFKKLSDTQQQIALMKLDVEGYEPNVLFGGKKFFASSVRPRAILMETLLSNQNELWGLGESGGGAKMKAMFAFLADSGYKPVNVVASVVEQGDWTRLPINTIWESSDE